MHTPILMDSYRVCLTNLNFWLILTVNNFESVLLALLKLHISIRTILFSYYPILWKHLYICLYLFIYFLLHKCLKWCLFIYLYWQNKLNKKIIFAVHMHFIWKKNLLCVLESAAIIHVIHVFCEEPRSVLQSCSFASWWLVDIRASKLPLKSVEIFHHRLWTCKAVVLQFSPEFIFHIIQSFISSPSPRIEARNLFQEMSHRSWDSACLSYNFSHYMSTGALMALNLSLT